MNSLPVTQILLAAIRMVIAPKARASMRRTGNTLSNHKGEPVESLTQDYGRQASFK
jgi:hypothetical protein